MYQDFIEQAFEKARIDIEADGIKEGFPCRCVVRLQKSDTPIRQKGSGREYVVRSLGASVVVCDDIQGKQKVSEEYLRQVERFHLHIDCGSFKPVIYLVDIKPLCIDLNGEWTFDLSEQMEDVKRLFPDVIF